MVQQPPAFFQVQRPIACKQGTKIGNQAAMSCPAQSPTPLGNYAPYAFAPSHFTENFPPIKANSEVSNITTRVVGTVLSVSRTCQSMVNGFCACWSHYKPKSHETSPWFDGVKSDTPKPVPKS